MRRRRDEGKANWELNGLDRILPLLSDKPDRSDRDYSADELKRQRELRNSYLITSLFGPPSHHDIMHMHCLMPIHP